MLRLRLHSLMQRKRNALLGAVSTVCFFLSSLALRHCMRSLTAALWRCVFVYVRVCKKVFLCVCVCLTDGAMSVTHPWFLCIWEWEREEERKKMEGGGGETSKQYIIRFIKLLLPIKHIQCNIKYTNYTGINPFCLLMCGFYPRSTPFPDTCWQNGETNIRQCKA